MKLESSRQIGLRNPKKLGEILSWKKGGNLDHQMTEQLRDSHADLERKVAEKTRDLSALYALTSPISQASELTGVLDDAVVKIIDVTGADAASIKLLDERGARLILTAHQGFPEAYTRENSVEMSQGEIGRQILRTGEAIISEEIINDSKFHRCLLARHGFRSAAYLPLKTSQSKVLGIMVLASWESGRLSTRQSEIFAAVAHQVSVALENTRLLKKAENNLQQLRALREIDQAITSTLDLDAILNVLLKKIDTVLPYAAATIRLINRENGVLEPVACRNLDSQEWKTKEWIGGRGLANAVFEAKTPTVVGNAQTDPRVLDREFYRKHRLVSYLGVPLIARGENLGVLNFYTKEEHEFSNEEVEFLSTIAGQAAIAIHNSQLYRESHASKTETEMVNQRLRKSMEELSRLYTALAPLTPTESIDEMIDGIIGRLMEATGADAALVRLRDKVNGGFVCASQRGFSDDYLSAADLVPVGSAVDRVFNSGEPIIVSDISGDSRLTGKVQLRVGLRSCAFLPLKARGEVRGIIHLASRKVGYFSEEQKDHLLAIARQMSIALENRALFDEIRASRDELAVADKGKTEFLSVMSHELRTPLNVIMGYTRAVKDGMLGTISEEQKLALNKAVSHSEDLLNLVTGILDATSIEAGVVTVESYAMSPDNFLDSLRSTYDIPLEKKVAFKWDYPFGLPPVETDSAKLTHILQNLINNAIKFTDEGVITISARHVPEAQALEFKVSDTGIGISKDSLPIIFEMFRQIDSSVTRAYGGVGLGLFIVKKLTQLLGGRVEVESEIGRGSTFTVTIPMILPVP